MKSIFTFLLLFSLSLLQAQDLTMSPSEMTISGEEGVYIGFGETELTNNGSETLEIAVRLERVCYNSGDETEIQICIDALCYFNVNVTTTWGLTGDAPVVLAPGESMDLLKFTPFGVGNFASEWKVVFFDRNNPTTEASLSVTITDDSLNDCINTSTTDFNYTIGKAFPNPATDMINISYEIEANEAQLNIYNAMGMLVESVAISPNAESVNVNVGNYSSGVYFYNVTDGKDQSRMMSFVK